MAKKVEGKLYEILTGQLFEIGRQLRQKNGYPFDPEQLKNYLQDAIEGRFSVKASVNSSSVGRFFMTVTLGTYPNVAELKQAVLLSGKKIRNYANQILDKSEIASEGAEIDLWEVSGTELGFTGPVSRGVIYQRARDLGFENCSAEAIALARIKCEDKKLRIGSIKPIRDSAGVLHVLRLCSDGGDFWLDTEDYGSSDDVWHLSSTWVFARLRRK